MNRYLAALLMSSFLLSGVHADVGTVSEGNTRFALNLYERLRGQDGNLFFSPYSISTALAMTYGGARGQTADQMAKTLHFSLPEAKLHPSFASLIKQVNGNGEKRSYELSTANALWGQKGFPFRKEFLTLTKDNYGAPLHEVNFAEATEQARQTINAWVEKETHDKIKDLLKPGVLGPDVRLVLTNAIYFKGKWASPFKKDLTREGPFHLGNGDKVQVPLMHQTDDYRYHDAGTYQILELPYAENHLGMVILLPKKMNGLADLEKGLNANHLKGLLGQLRKREVEVTLPRFKTTDEFSLAKTLGEMGMPLAFSNSADFSGMTESEKLFLSHVIHKAFVDVNEEGTEAAAATAIVARPTSLPIPQQRVVFRADHPFIYLIRDLRNGSILFMGRLANPK